MAVIDLIKQKFNKDMYNKWLNFHNYITSIDTENIDKAECRNIVKEFNIVCDYTTQMICETVIKNGYDHNNCPFYTICLHGGGQGHQKYFSLYRAALIADIETVKQILSNVPTDSINSLNIVKDNI